MNPLLSTEPPTATGGNLQTIVYRSRIKGCFFALWLTLVILT